MSEKEHALRECRKLLDILNTWGNILVPSLPNKKETFALERLEHFVRYLHDEKGLTIDNIDEEILKLDK